MDITVNRAGYTQTRQKKRKSHGFVIFFVMYIEILVILSIGFLLYVWNSIDLYEQSMPENVVEEVISEFHHGEGYDKIVYPTLAISEFTSMDVIKEQYEDILKTASLTYQYGKGDYLTGNQIYYLYAEDKMIGKLTLGVESEENRLGILKISNMKALAVEPVLDIAAWNCQIKALSDQTVYVNGVRVSEQYQAGEPKNHEVFTYLYDYVELPVEVTYQLGELYEKPQIQIVDRDGNEIAYVEKNAIVDATEYVQQDKIPEEISKQVDVLSAAKDWSLFTTKDLAGANYGLASVRRHFIKDSYMWKKLGEYAHGVDITFVSAHDRSKTYFTEEKVSEFTQYTKDCFSCRIAFEKHMRLNIGREQVDQTDSIFYFVNYDDTDDGIDNPEWKIADIQAVTK